MLDQTRLVRFNAHMQYFAVTDTSISLIPPTDNVVVNQLFGVNTGLGMGILTFDWTQITWIGSPLQVPWWAEVNIGVGFIFFYWILCPILYYTNVSFTVYFRH